MATGAVGSPADFVSTPLPADGCPDAIFDQVAPAKFVEAFVESRNAVGPLIIAAVRIAVIDTPGRRRRWDSQANCRNCCWNDHHFTKHRLFSLNRRAALIQPQPEGEGKAFGWVPHRVATTEGVYSRVPGGCLTGSGWRTFTAKV